MSSTYSDKVTQGHISHRVTEKRSGGCIQVCAVMYMIKQLKIKGCNPAEMLKHSPHGAVLWLQPLILHLPCAVWDDVRTCTRSFLWSEPGVCVPHDDSPRPQSHLRTGRTKCARTFCGHLLSISAGRRIRKHCNLYRIRWHFGFIEPSNWEIVKNISASIFFF